MLRRVSYQPIEFESISQAFLFAAEFGSTEICQLILHKLSQGLRQKLVNPALLLAAKNGHIPVCKYMLSCGADIETRGINGETPLLIAADNNHEKMCRFLLQRGNADLFCTDNDGNSLLHVACRRGYASIAQLVLRYADREGLSAIQFSLNARKEAPIEVAKSEKLVRMVLVHCIETQSASTEPFFYNFSYADCTGTTGPSPPSTTTTNNNNNNNNNNNGSNGADQSNAIKDSNGCNASGGTSVSRVPSRVSSGVSSASRSQIRQPLKRQMENPFKPLPVDNPDVVPTSHLFWRTIGCGKDRCVFQSFAVYPFDRLQDSERIVILTRVAEAMSGYKTDLKCNILNESTLYVIFAMMKRHIKEEIVNHSKTPRDSTLQHHHHHHHEHNGIHGIDGIHRGDTCNLSSISQSDCYKSNCGAPNGTPNGSSNGKCSLDQREVDTSLPSPDSDCCSKCVDDCNQKNKAKQRGYNAHSSGNSNSHSNAPSNSHPPSCSNTTNSHNVHNSHPSCSMNDASPTPTPPPSSSASTSSSSTIEIDIEATTYSGTAVGGTFTASSVSTSSSPGTSSSSSSSSSSPSSNPPYLWRNRTLTAFEHLFQIDGFRAGLKKQIEEMSVWSTIIDLIASTIFGDSFWSKQRMFLCGNTFNRRQFVTKKYMVPPSYWVSVLPDKCDLTSDQIQVMYRKLVTMSKSLLRKNPHQHIKSNENASLCFCPDCIADRQVPLRFKLQFLEEQAEEKQKKQHKKFNRKKTVFSKALATDLPHHFMYVFGGNIH